MKIPVQENKFVPVEEGIHFGKVLKVEYRHEPYEYTDLWVSVDDAEGAKLKYGCPTSISESSSLGRLLANFGASIIPGQDIEPEKVLMGAETLKYSKSEDGKIDIYQYPEGQHPVIKVKFMTQNEVSTVENVKKEYPRIVKNSLKKVNDVNSTPTQ